MADLDDIVKAMFGAPAQESIAEHNPYYQFAPIGQAFAEGALGAKTRGDDPRRELWNKAIAASIGTALTGGLKGLGQGKQEELTRGYLDAVFKGSDGSGLPSGLFQKVQQQKELLDVLDTIKQRDAAQDLTASLSKLLFSSKLKNQQKLLEISLTSNNPKIREQAASLLKAAEGSLEQEPAPLEVVEGASSEPVSEDEKAIQQYENILERTGDPKAALKIVEQTLQKEQAKTKGVEALYAEDGKSLRDSATKLNDLTYALDRVGDTGGLPYIEEPMREGRLLLQEYLGNDEAADRRAARADLTSQAVVLSGEIRKMFPGQVSNYEMQQYLKAVPGLNKTPEQNKAILARFQRALVAGKQRFDFLEKAMSLGATRSQAEMAYNKFDAALPLFDKGEINQNRLKLSVDSIPIDALLRGESLIVKKKDLELEPEQISETPPPEEQKEAISKPVIAAPPKQGGGGLLSIVEGAATDYLRGAAAFGDSATFGLAPRLVAGAETVGREIADLFGRGEGKSVSQNYKESLAGARGVIEEGKKESPISSGAGELVGLFANPVNKLKPIQALFKAKGAAGVAGRAAFGGGMAAAQPSGEEGVSDRVENAALFSATIDAVSKGVGKLAGPAMKTLIHATGLSTQNYKDAAKGLPKAAMNKAREKFSNALRILDKEQGLTKRSLVGGNENVMLKLAYKANESIISRGQQVDNIIAEADRLLPNGISPNSISISKAAKMVGETSGADQPEAISEINKIITGFVNKAKSKSGKITLRDVEAEKRGFNQFYKPEASYRDAVSTAAKDFRTTIVKQIEKLESAGKMAKGSADKLKKLYAEEHDLITLRNAYAARLPGAMGEDVITAAQKKLYTTGGAGTGGAALVGGSIGGETGAKAAVISAVLSSLNSLRRPAAKAISFGEVEQLLQSPKFRSLVVGLEKDALGRPDKDIDWGGVLDLRGESDYELGTASKKKTESMTTAPKTEIDSLIEEVAAAKGLEPKLLRALAMQESGLNPKATSKYNPGVGRAKGILQLVDSTAKELAQKQGLKDFDIYDPKTNLSLGADYLKELLDKFDGDLELALTAYHSGPGRVTRLLGSRKQPSLDDIMEGLGPVGKVYARSVLKKMQEEA